LFVTYRVDAVFSGHEHFYQRIKPQKGIHYFVSGGGGQVRTGDIGASTMTAAGFDADRSFMLVEVANKELLFQAISRTGKTVDKGAIPMREPVRTTAGAGVPEVIWRDPGPVASLNLLDAGGTQHGPDAKGRFTFLREDTQATNPTFDIADQQGVEWKVTLGEEARSETAATRLVRAAGYFVDEDYYLAELTVRGVTILQRGGGLVSASGVIRGARLARRPKGVEKLRTWDWFDNPFLGKRDLNGLRVLMALLSNWDLKEVNNSIYEIGGERRYTVTDLGTSFGNTGNSLTRATRAPQEYADSTFVESARSDFIDFVLHNRPVFPGALNVPNDQTRARMEDVTKQIPRADAKWLGRRLSMLSDAQIRDCFVAAGYTREVVGVYAAAVRKRIAALNGL
jgi:hypothetical protein